MEISFQWERDAEISKWPKPANSARSLIPCYHSSQIPTRVRPLAHTTKTMDQLGTPHIIDFAILGAALLYGVAGFWRGVAREVFISASLLLGNALAVQWSPRWGEWVADHSRLALDESVFAVAVATLVVVSVLMGYVGCTMAGLPPADAPGRVGGLVIGATNGVFFIAVILDWARALVLSTARRQTLQASEIGSRLSENIDWVLLATTLVAVAVVVVSWQVRRRRILIVSVAPGPRQADSGFRFRRGSPLAPEAEKIERQTGSVSEWSVPATFAETAPLTRVPDPSIRSDRAVAEPRQVDANPALWRTEEVVRCISCGERIGDDDKFCPRCGRQLT
jgi:uncharacterized membrane protein required for colicin V production